MFVSVEEYNKYKVIKVNILKEDIVFLSDEFRTEDYSDRTINQLLVYTKDSIGNYVYPIKRIKIYPIMVIVYWITIFYTSINVIKIITLYITNKKRIKKQEI